MICPSAAASRLYCIYKVSTLNIILERSRLLVQVIEAIDEQPFGTLDEFYRLEESISSGEEGDNVGMQGKNEDDYSDTDISYISRHARSFFPCSSNKHAIQLLLQTICAGIMDKSSSVEQSTFIDVESLSRCQICKKETEITNEALVFQSPALLQTFNHGACKNVVCET